jgi:hypothetical protein
MRLLIALLTTCSIGYSLDLVARASAGFTTASTWGPAETGASATQLTRSSSTNTTTSYVYSSAFTCTNLDVIEGVLMRAKRVNSTGTVSIALSEDNGTTATRSVTVNASDLTLTDDTWVFFKLGSTLTCDGGADYKVGITGSSAGNATFYRDGTAGNWTRILRTNGTRTPAAADTFYIAGEWTAAATVTALTVTLNETATTDYGLMDIGQNGTATAGTTAATNYYLRLSGDLNVWAGGTLSLGTVGTPVPSGSTFKLNFDCGSNVQYGLIVNNQGTFIAQGASKTVRALLAANAAGGATSITTDVSTGWLNGDEIAIASTSQTGSESEKKTMSGAATGTSVPITALASAHSGTSPTQAELANLTRNVQIFGASASLQTFVLFAATSTADVDYTEFYWMGSNTANKRGIDIAVTTGSVDMQYSSFHDFIVVNSEGAYVSALGSAGTLNLDHNVSAFIAARHFQILGTANTTWVVNDALMIRNTDNTNIVILSDVGGTFTNNTVAGSVNSSIEIGELLATPGTFSGITVHSGGSTGIHISTRLLGTLTFTNTTIWRCNGRGFFYNAGSSAKLRIVFDGFTAFGNSNYNLQIMAEVISTLINNATISGDSTFSSPVGLYLSSSGPVTINNSQFGVVSGIKVAHTTSDIYFENSGYKYVTGSNSAFSSTNPFTANNGVPGGVIGINKFGQVSGDNRTYTLLGDSNAFSIVRTDSVIFNTAAPSSRITPPIASVKSVSSIKSVALNSGAASTVSVWVRKSISTDAGGVNYNGNQPRLMIQTNPSAGIGTGATDVVCDTMTAAVGTWEQLTCSTGAVSENTVLAFYVDLDGTAGWVNVDDWTVTNPQPTGAEKYWFNGGTQLTLPGSGGSAATLAYPTVN